MGKRTVQRQRVRCHRKLRCRPEQVGALRRPLRELINPAQKQLKISCFSTPSKTEVGASPAFFADFAADGRAIDRRRSLSLALRVIRIRLLPAIMVLVALPGGLIPFGRRDLAVVVAVHMREDHAGAGLALVAMAAVMVVSQR